MKAVVMLGEKFLVKPENGCFEWVENLENATYFSPDQAVNIAMAKTSHSRNVYNVRLFPSLQ